MDVLAFDPQYLSTRRQEVQRWRFAKKTFREPSGRLDQMLATVENNQGSSIAQKREDRSLRVYFPPNTPDCRCNGSSNASRIGD
jgi:hypothetical protein